MRQLIAAGFAVMLGVTPMADAEPAAAAGPAPAPAAASADPAAADKLLACMKANLPPTVRIQTIEVTSFDRAGSERTLKGTVYATREPNNKASVLLRVDAPADLARSAYLVRETSSGDDIHIYLPAVNRTRRITGAAVDGNLWGSDISYNDIKQLQGAFDGSGLKLEAATQIDGQPVEVLTLTPKPGSSTKYNLIRASIDAKTCLPVKAEFLQGSDVRKLMTSAPKDFKQSGTRWYPAEILVQTPAEGTRTRVRVTGVSSGDKLSARFFNPTAFYQ